MAAVLLEIEEREVVMELEELEIHKPCVACGDLIVEGLSPMYQFGEDDEVLCWDCAIARGGQHDAEHDRWIVPPNTGDLGLHAKEVL